jgi:hypothetical protein
VTARHPLDALLRPRSIALLGASEKPDSAGRAMIEMARIDGYAGAVFPVNYRHARSPACPAIPARCAVDRAEMSPETNARLSADEAVAHGRTRSPFRFRH